MSADRTPDYQSHHLTTGRVVAALLMFAVAFSVFDVVRRGAFVSTLPGLLFLLGGCALSYVLGLRPAVVEGIGGVEVRNPLRTTYVPWRALTDTDVTDVLRVHAGALVVRCFAVPRRRPPVTRNVRSAQRYGFGLPPSKPDVDPVDLAEIEQGRTAGMGGTTASMSPAEGRAEALARRLRRMAERSVASGAAGSEAEVVGPRLAPDALAAVLVAGLLALAGLLGAVL